MFHTIKSNLLCSPRQGLKAAGRIGLIVAIALCSVTCVLPDSTLPFAKKPTLAPTTQPGQADVLQLDKSRIKPLYREMLPVDLPTVARVANAQNLDIVQARQQVEASRGRLESAAGGAFPTIAPGASFEHVEGTVRAVEGQLVPAGFNTFQLPLAVQWAINPGKVVYEIVASKKRLYGSLYREQAVLMETLRAAAIQYYELVLNQARVSAAYQSLAEAKELVRINDARVQNGTGVRVDQLRAQARLAEREQDLTLAVNAFYSASVSLAVTLRLDSAVTLVPNITQVTLAPRVADNYDLEDLLVIASEHRPDLQAVRALAAAGADDRRGVWWGAWGPQAGAGYQISGITGHANNVVKGKGISNNLILNPASPAGTFSTNPFANGAIRETISRLSQATAADRDATFGFSGQQRSTASVGWRFSLSAFGEMRSSKAAEQQALVEAAKRLDQVRADVVLGRQASLTQKDLIAQSKQQLAAADEALRLTQANLEAGTMTTLDVLQAQDAVAQARLRYAQAVIRFNQAQINLLAALGLMDESCFR